jgi:hypothetical protein
MGHTSEIPVCESGTKYAKGKADQCHSHGVVMSEVLDADEVFTMRGVAGEFLSAKHERCPLK